MSETERKPLDVAEVLAIMLDQLASIAWQKLGLQPDPMTGTQAPDLAQAEMAIDVCAELTKHIRPSLEESDQRQIDNLIRDLRVNFMQRKST